jgi:hypothetical protein
MFPHVRSVCMQGQMEMPVNKVRKISLIVLLFIIGALMHEFIWNVLVATFRYYQYLIFE